MSHGSYDLNLGSKRLILARDIRSRSWPHIGDSYGMMVGFFKHCQYIVGIPGIPIQGIRGGISSWKEAFSPLLLPYSALLS